MISTENSPINRVTTDQDFTVTHYRKLLRLAVDKYEVVSYSSVPWGNRFVLWRHDLDYSLNRALVLAKIEREEGVKAAYFVNAHSEFYNISEAAQHGIMMEILALGHDLGLHFDASFHNVTSEQDLNRFIAQESEYLRILFGISPVAFSFHNPVPANLVCEAESQGGLVNCYSKRFKTEVAYCSDSNGYWRFRRLHDVLAEAKDSCLQVLTHPGWWQDAPMPPRQRVFRAAYGRAASNMRIYDAELEQHGRLNHAGSAAALRLLKDSTPQQFELYDNLWNQGQFETLFVELSRLHAAQINRLCKAQLRKEWSVPALELDAFFSQDGLRVDGWKLFSEVFGIPWTQAANLEEAANQRWLRVRDQLIHGRSSPGPNELERGCEYLTRVIQRLAEWGAHQPIGYDGLSHIGTIRLPRSKTAVGNAGERIHEAKQGNNDIPRNEWEQFKQRLLNGDSNG